MPRTLWDASARQELEARFAHLVPTRPALWGRFSAEQMVAHVADALRMATGALPVAPKGGPLRYTPIKQAIIYWLPFPRGAPTAPELVTRRPAGWDREIADVRDLLRDFAARPVDGAWPEHPVFGRLSGAQWGVLGYRHTDHHLRQFGV